MTDMRTHYVGDNCPGGHKEMDRHHQNNLDHARTVFLSVLFSSSPHMWDDEVNKIRKAVEKRISGE